MTSAIIKGTSDSSNLALSEYSSQSGSEPFPSKLITSPKYFVKFYSVGINALTFGRLSSGCICSQKVETNNKGSIQV